MAVPFTYHAKAQSTFKPPLIANENAFLGDVISRYAIAQNIYSSADPLTYSTATRIMPRSPSPAGSIAWRRGPRWSTPIPTMR